jgi:hypothetical protein
VVSIKIVPPKRKGRPSSPAAAARVAGSFADEILCAKDEVADVSDIPKSAIAKAFAHRDFDFEFELSVLKDFKLISLFFDPATGPPFGHTSFALGHRVLSKALAAQIGTSRKSSASQELSTLGAMRRI